MPDPVAPEPKPAAPAQETPPETPAEDPHAKIKEAIAGALQPHLGSGGEAGKGHVIDFHKESGALHHSHPADADPEKLAQVKAALEGLEGVTGVIQEAEKSTPPDDTWGRVYGTKGADEMADDATPAPTNPKDPPAPPSAEEVKRITATVKQMPPQALAFYLKLQKSLAGAALKACVRAKLAGLEKSHPSLTKDQREALAYGMCDGKACKDLNDASPGGANPLEDAADESVPHGVGHAKSTLAHHAKAMPRMHPSDKEFYKSVCGLVKEHAEAEYPDHGDHFKEFADVGETGAGKPDQPPAFDDGGEDEEKGAAATAAALAPYKSYKGLAVKRLERSLGGAALKLFEDAAAQFKELAALKPGDRWTQAHRNAALGLAKQFKGAVDTFGKGAQLDALAAPTAPAGEGEQVIKSLGGVLTEAVKEMIYPLTGKLEHKPGFASAKK